eukprot:g4639.t2
MRIFTAVLLLGVSLSVTDAKHKLNVDLYLEALCPYCRNLVSSVLTPIFDSGLDKHMNLHLYYAGNAKLQHGRLECQHGYIECYLNKVLGCGMARKSTAKEWYPFVQCIESYGESAMDKEAVEICAKKVNLNGNEIVECAEGEEGEKIQRAAYDKIQALDPPHRWVPWGVINGKPVEDEIYKLKSKLCKVAHKHHR